MAKKITVVEKYEELLNKYSDLLTKEELEFLTERKELVQKKNASRKPSATVTANEGIKENIIKEMEQGVAYTITDMMKNLPSCKELSNQKISALVRQLLENGSLTRAEVKGKAYFTLSE